MKKRKNVIIPMMLAAAVAAASVPCSSQDVEASSNTYEVSVSKGYLALRSSMAYDSSNEIGELYSGDLVEVTEYTNVDYWYVYSPKYDCWGYVNNDYLVSLYSQSGGYSYSTSYTVSVSKGYLALRNAKAYDSSNEIGKLYSGDTVQLLDTSDSQYWYVYAPKYDMNGYVNKDYLIGGTAYTTKTVSVATGYLALRNAKAYDSSNEIGQLYSGDTVQLIDSSDAQYWYVYSPKLYLYGYVNKDYLY